jgi:mercuric ion transport protein
MNQKHALLAGAVAGIGASLCCVVPWVLLSLGLGGAWLARLTAFEPLRPIFLGLTLFFVGMAFRKRYPNPTVCGPGRGCADDASIRRQRLVFWAVAIPLLGLVAFPWIVPMFY